MTEKTIRIHMKFIVAFFILVLSAATAQAAAISGMADLNDDERQECLKRKGGDTPENQKKCDDEAADYKTYLQDCMDHMRANNMDSYKCRQDALRRSQD